MVKLENCSDNSIPVYDMRDGEIGVITVWNNDNIYIGRVVQRFQTTLITLGANGGNSFPSVFNSKSETLRVRILPAGTKLVV